jgi:radical SAM protein with 4Fe4S-binding SPASM domain
MKVSRGGGVFSAAFHDAFSDGDEAMNSTKYVPENAVWELTLRCNMNCLHCGSSAGRARANELTVEECLRVADDLLRLGCRQITFIGGEIFLYRGWEKVARRVSDGGATTNIITNAYRMGVEEIARIKEAKLNNVGISLDGMEENHDRIRRKKGSYKKVLAAFGMLRQVEIPIAVVTSLLDFNVADLEEMYNLLVANEVAIWQLQIVTGMGNMAGKEGYLFDPAKVGQITRFIREKCRSGELKVYAGDDIGYFDEHEVYIRSRPGTISVWNGCQAGIRVVGIDSVGNVKGCESIYSEKFIEGSLRKESLEEIWTKEGNFAYNRNFDKSMLSGACAVCDKGSICRGGCRGSNYFSSGSFFESRYCSYPGRPACNPTRASCFCGVYPVT